MVGPLASDASALAAARDPATSPARLTTLARDRRPEVRAAVAANPNTPLDVLFAIGGGHPDALATNPILAWLSVEDPEFLANFPAVVRRRLLAVSSGALAWWAARYGDDDDHGALIANPRTQAEVIEWLIAHASAPVAAQARLHVTHTRDVIDDNVMITDAVVACTDPSQLDALLALGVAPGWLLPTAAASSEPWLRLRAARHRDCPPRVLRVLAIDADADVRSAAREHARLDARTRAMLDALDTPDAPDAPDATVTFGADDIAWLRSSAIGQAQLACRRDLPPDVVDQMVASTAWTERQLVAASPSLTFDAALRLAADGDSDVRNALVGNPVCPPAILALLDRDHRDASTVVDSGTGSGALLDRLAGYGGNGPLAAAQHPGATAEQLTRWVLDVDWRVRQACARHPRVPAVVLARLTNDPDQDVRAAVVTAQLGEGPTTPTAAVAAAASDTHGVVRAAVAARIADASVLDALADDSDTVVLVALAANPSLPPAALARLARREDTAVLAALAARDDMPDDVLTDLAGRDDPTIAAALVRRADLPADGRARLFVNAPHLAGAATDLATNPGALDDDVVAALLDAVPWTVEVVLAAPAIPNGACDALAGHGDWRVRERVALHAGCPTSVLERLSTDTDYDVRKAVAAHPRASAAAVERLVADDHRAVRIAVVRRTDTSPTALVRLLSDEDDEIRALACAHPNCPADASRRRRALEGASALAPSELQTFAGGPTGDRVLVARHPHTPADLLTRLAGDDAWRVREAAAGNPRTPPTTLAAVAGDADRDVRRAAAGNPSTPREALTRLADDSDDSVVRVACAHPHLDDASRDAVLARFVFAASRSPSVASRAAAASSPRLARRERRRRRLWQSPDWAVRYGIAINPVTDADLLGTLANDGHRVVRAAAQAQLAVVYGTGS